MCKLGDYKHGKCSLNHAIRDCLFNIGMVAFVLWPLSLIGLPTGDWISLPIVAGICIFLGGLGFIIGSGVEFGGPPA